MIRINAEKKDASPQTDDEVKEEKPQQTPEDEKTEDSAATPADSEKKSDKKADKKGKKDEKKPSEKKKEEPKIDELAVLTDKYLRVCAEYDNFRRRSQKEKESLYGDIKADTVIKFLPVYDNLVRAMAQPSEDEVCRKGVEMIFNQFVATLDKLGVTEIECLGAKFDPELHNAVMHVEDEEKGESEIVEVFQKGFRLGDKVIRFAMVKVAN